MQPNGFFREWPYYPPSPIAGRFVGYPAPGLICLSDAIDRIGRARLPDTWTGKEIEARHGCPKWPKDVRPVYPIPVREVRDEPGQRGAPCWRVFATRNGRRATATEAEAKDVWRAEEPFLLEMWKAEAEARERFEIAKREFQTALVAGTLKSTLIYRAESWARPYDVDPLTWITDAAEAALDLTHPMRRDKSGPNILTIEVPGSWTQAKATGTVFVAELDVERFIRSTAKAEAPAETPAITPKLEAIIAKAAARPKPGSVEKNTDDMESWFFNTYLPLVQNDESGITERENDLIAALRAEFPRVKDARGHARELWKRADDPKWHRRGPKAQRATGA